MLICMDAQIVGEGGRVRVPRPGVPADGAGPAVGPHHDERDPGDARFAVAVGTFKLLADDTRLRILWALLGAEHTVGGLAAEVGIRPAAASQHLARLRAAHLVRVRRDGNRMHYAVDDTHVGHLVRQALFHGDHVVARPGADAGHDTEHVA
jgi:DNA-binding transcriptional ArsR family regulator